MHRPTSGHVGQNPCKGKQGQLWMPEKSLYRVRECRERSVNEEAEKKIGQMIPISRWGL